VNAPKRRAQREITYYDISASGKKKKLARLRELGKNQYRKTRQPGGEPAVEEFARVANTRRTLDGNGDVKTLEAATRQNPNNFKKRWGLRNFL